MTARITDIQTSTRKSPVFSIYDIKSRQYQPPFVMRTIEEAIRGFSYACKKDGSNFKEFPADFTLYQVAFFDDELGQLESLQPIALSNAAEHAHAKD